MTNDILDDSVSVRLAVLSAVGIMFLSLIGIGISLVANSWRQSTIAEMYANETQRLLSEYPQATKVFFTEVFENCRQELELKKTTMPNTFKNESTLNCGMARESLAQMHVDTLKDSSSIVYVKVNGTSYESISASATYHAPEEFGNSLSYSLLFSPESGRKFRRIIENDPAVKTFDDFITYQLDGKEVVVPIEIDGERIGYILEVWLNVRTQT